MTDVERIAVPSEKVTQILRSKSDLSEEQIAAMSEREGWAWIYSHPAPKRPADPRPEICFTGFLNTERDALETRARAANLKVVGSVTKHLRYLCTGEAPGETKLEKALIQGAVLLTVEEFEALLSAGKFPSD
jgi:NAD-dependent DNA ligase